MIIAVPVPTNFFMDFNVVKCWLAIPKLDFQYVYLQSCYIDTNRNKAVEIAKNAKEDLLMIDSDIIFSPDDVMRMRNHLRMGKEVVTGVYPIFMEDAMIPSIYKLVEGKYMPCEVQEGTVDACGGGFLGISYSVLERLPKDPFTRLKEDDVVYGEDISFCRQLQKIGISPFCDPKMSVGQVRINIKRLS